MLYTTFYEARDCMEGNALLKNKGGHLCRSEKTCCWTVSRWPSTNLSASKNKKQKENAINMDVIFFSHFNHFPVRVYRQNRNKMQSIFLKKRHVARAPEPITSVYLDQIGYILYNRLPVFLVRCLEIDRPIL